MKLSVSCELDFQIDANSALILMLRPARGGGQRIMRETYTLNPDVPVIAGKDGYGNCLQRLVAPKGRFFIHSSAEVITLPPAGTAPGAGFIEIQNLPAKVLPFLLPSRYCESDRFGELASRIVANALPGYDQVSRIVDWLRASIQYRPGSTDFPLSAIEIHQLGYGVCRDLAHLGIALCHSSVRRNA
ncbi:MAG: hypothetical protein CVV13_08495 [Gammaproteobacteria bacterium HGW-Gammaproteobacteria-3]|jgi:transglutaminase-like putative cysteine protease|nr:MAG: hypothetical protein CVV13_08495 [Gammaproteobacteria bacterium HGW-Gammaproteobacteria-3]